MGRVLKWLAFLMIGTVGFIVVGCSTVGLPRVNAKPAGVRAEPNLLTPIGGMEAVTSVRSWEDERAPFWADMLLSQVYGSMPPDMETRVISREMISDNLLDGKARLEAVKLQFGNTNAGLVLDVHFVIPNTDGPHPLILGASFCPNHTALPFDGVEPPDAIYPKFCDRDSWATPIFKFIFGMHIVSPPIEDIVDHGFAFGAYYPGQIVPDSSEAAPQVLANFPRGEMSHGPYSAIGLWAWSASRIVDYVETDDLLNEDQIILFGHSRYGKSSLLAGALDKRVAGVIAHQSGTGGASLQKNGVGEPIGSITRNYPHWFTPSYALYAERAQDLPFDQHALVALMAPRALLLGNSARDKWSDPKGSFDAARAAAEVYRLYGIEGFHAKTLKDYLPEDMLSFEFREGTHGITTEDWRYFLAWLDAHFGEAG